MPFAIICNDITKVHADAIVNAANSSLLGGGGVDGAIHRAAGPELLAECRTLGGCQVGQAKITKGYRLPASYIIHTVGPVWQGGTGNEEQLLTDCYTHSLALAKEQQLKSVAFPLISSGAFGYPKDRALQVAISAIGAFLLDHEMTVYLVIYDKSSFTLSEKLFLAISQYIDDHYIEEPLDESSDRIVYSRELKKCYSTESICSNLAVTEISAAKKARNLDEIIKQMDETFSQMLLRLIDQKGMTDAKTYKRANLDRKLFSKIRNDLYYKPSKPTVIALSIALRLNLDETNDLLLRAGFALSNCSKFDVIIKFFIEQENYNIFEINQVLFQFDQSLLGN